MQLLTLPPSPALATSIRATAQVFEDPKSQALLDHIQQVAPSEASVLIIGETGTGKELVARHIHNLSARRNRPFVAVNCGAFSESLVEAELFGHEKGAFTGALSAKAGWFEEADGGTLFLDEIGDLPMAIQVKLLRVLQEREVVRLGSRKSIPIDVRVLAATNVQLEKAINAGHFREDLYYRLDVVSLELSPLRDRPGDILPLTRHFIEAYSQRLGYGEITISREAEHKLKSYSWPGNIRELENVIHHTLLICRNGVIERDDLRLSNMRIERQDDSQHGTDNSAEALLARAFQKLFEEQAGALHEKVEDALLRAAYRFIHCRGNQHFRVAGAGAEALLAGELAPAAKVLDHGAGVQRVEGVAPEPVFACGLFEPGLPLVRARKQAHGGEHQVVEAEDMGDGAVDLGELTHDAQGVAPACAEAAVLGGNAQGQQAALAQGVTFGFGGATALVTFDGGEGEFGGQQFGGLQW